MKLQDKLPIITLRDVVLFPEIIFPLLIEREVSLNSLEIALKNNSNIIFVTQRDSSIENPKTKDFYSVGVVAKILQVIKFPNNSIKLLVEALYRVTLNKVTEFDEILFAKFEELPDKGINVLDEDAMSILMNLIEKFVEYSKINKKISAEVLESIMDYKNPAYATNLIISHCSCKTEDKQRILETTNVLKRIHDLMELISKEIIIIQTNNVIQAQIKKQIEKTQRDYYLNEQIKAIQKELGDGEDKPEIAELLKKMKQLKLTKEAQEKAEHELKKYKMMNTMSAEAVIVKNYLDTLLGMPWGKQSKTKVDIVRAEEQLNKDHYGLSKIKERIIEYLAILQRSTKSKGPILCLIGPPGVGKTSLVKSIAEATGRRYAKFSLGGLKDEAEIRGHRRTYLGSMPGKIISLIKKTKTDNPVILLDEIDKMGTDFRNDPSSALLEVLDPEQNSCFVDHYLEVEYDLSNIMFIATANSMDLPRPLLDRMEILFLSGYVEEEKMEIAKQHLIPKQIKMHYLKKSEFSIENEALLEIIRYYTKESGVRNLEREIGALARKSLKKILSDKSIKHVNICSNFLENFLGTKKYRFNFVEEEDLIGTTTGLAYTDFGGDLLSIEAVNIPGKCEIKATGKLGEVMRESIQTAFSFFRSRSEYFGVSYEKYKENDIHLHVPEGAVPKDGPSAGIAIFTTIISLITNIPVKRTVAMTGEITLRGRVLAIGGLKEKLLAASRGGIKTVIIPQDNVKDLKDIPNSIKDTLEIIPVTTAEQVLSIALTKPIHFK